LVRNFCSLTGLCLASGNNVEDYENHVLCHMFRHLKGRTSYSDPANDDEEEIMVAAVALNDDVGMPMDYYIHGWIGFKLFGPFARDEFKSILLLTKDCVLIMARKNQQAVHQLENWLQRNEVSDVLLICQLIAPLEAEAS